MQEVNILKIVWPRLPDKRPFWREKPLLYLKHIFGNKGPNSLLSELVKQELALNIVAGQVVRLMATKTEFYLAVTLTNKGAREHEKILRIVFGFINRLKESHPPSYI